jgi:serine/threonine-protein kinase
MTDRDARIDRLYALALEQPAAAREAFLQGVAEDDDVKAAVRAVLAAEEYAGDFLSGTAADALDEPPLAPGTTLGQYRIERLLGRGGMGIVYEAEDTRLHRRVALKAVAPGLAGDERQRERLEREARAAAALTHPGIATVYALEEIDGHVFIASEYLDGETLRAEIDAGPLPLGRAIDVAVQLARALAAAHARHVVHRDLKPENVIRTASGALKILDFGLAQIVDTGDPRSRTRPAAPGRLTQTGVIAGTPSYMSPEQLRGRTTDFHTDHFSLAILLYEALTGRHPFAGPTPDAVMAQILTVPPDPPEIPAEMPPALWEILERSLRKNPADRYPSTTELLQALEALGTGTAVASAPMTAASASTPIAVSPPDITVRDVGAVRWWRFHQFAAAVAYWTMVWPAWIVHRGLGRLGLAFFFTLLAAIVVAGNLRLHLWFSSRVYPEDLAARRRDVAWWIRGADSVFAALLIAAGIALPPERAGWAAVLISFGIGAAVAAFIIEPATARAAFRHDEATEARRHGET